VGFALAATILRQREVAAHHLPALGLGYRRGRFRWSPHQAQGVHLAGLIDLFMATPLVTVQMATEKLKVTPQAVEVMLGELGPGLSCELTGRKGYRAWGIVQWRDRAKGVITPSGGSSQVGCLVSLVVSMTSFSDMSALAIARHMWNGPQCKGFFSRFHHAGTVRSYVRPLCAAYDRWPR
jgi:hypothetical protein